MKDPRYSINKDDDAAFELSYNGGNPILTVTTKIGETIQPIHQATYESMNRDFTTGSNKEVSRAKYVEKQKELKSSPHFKHKKAS